MQKRKERSQDQINRSANIIVLAKNYKNADTEEKKKDSLDAMIIENQKLVYHVASAYNQLAEKGAFDFDDLVQEGNLGLYRAIEKYDPDLGYTFSTYAIPWIRQSIERAFMKKGSTIHVPVYQVLRYNKIRRVVNSYEKEQGRQPSMEEIAEKTNLSVEEIMETVNLNENAATMSLSTPVGNLEGKESELGDIIISDRPGPEKVIDDISYNDLLTWLKSILTEREFDILCRRSATGVYSKVWTLQEIGDVYGLSRERVRQIEKLAVEKAKKAYPRYRQIKKRYCNVVQKNSSQTEGYN